MKHLIAIEHHIAEDCFGNVLRGTKLSLGYFTFAYVCTIDKKRSDTTSKEAGEFDKLTDNDLTELHEFIINHPLFDTATNWFEEKALQW